LRRYTLEARLRHTISAEAKGMKARAAAAAAGTAAAGTTAAGTIPNVVEPGLPHITRQVTHTQCSLLPRVS
jgi:hypothetical protein